MVDTVQSIDELEALLSDLDDLELEPAPAPVVASQEVSDEEMELIDIEEPVQVTATSAAEAELDDLDLADLEEPSPAAAIVTPQEEALLAELGGDAAAAEKAADPQPESNAGLSVVELVKRKRANAKAAVPETPLSAPIAQAVVTELPPDDEIDALLEAAVSAKPPAGIAEQAIAPAPAAGVSAPKASQDGGMFAFAPGNELSTFIEADRLKQDLEFSDANISTAMTRQAPLFAHYSTLAHKAQYQADRAKQHCELVEAQLNQAFRDQFISEGVKYTEKMIESAIIRDAGYQAAMKKRHEASAIAEMVKSAADSFRHRRDMLIQVGADLREEKKGSPVVKEHPGVAAMNSLRNRA